MVEASGEWPTECISCGARECERSQSGTLDICIYGIAYFNDGQEIRRKRENVPMRHIAENLRHELHKVVQYIVSQANLLDVTLNTRHIDLSLPASRIVGAAVMLDNFIEMITGVYDFHGIKIRASRNAVSLSGTVKRLFDTYSLIKNTRRASTIYINMHIDDDIVIEVLPAVIEYMVALLSDNLWKYSINESTVAIEAIENNNSLLDISFSNYGATIPQTHRLFEKGYKANPKSEGFGFGLNWAKTLCHHYNSVLGREERSPDATDIVYAGSITDDGFHVHRFTVTNVVFERRR